MTDKRVEEMDTGQEVVFMFGWLAKAFAKEGIPDIDFKIYLEICRQLHEKDATLKWAEDRRKLIFFRFGEWLLREMLAARKV